MSKSILITVVIVVVVFVGAYFLSQDNSTQPPESNSPIEKDTTQEPSGDSAPSAAPRTADVNEIIVRGTEFAFSPSAITVEAGENVRLTFRNEGNAPHDFVIENVGIRTSIISGGQSDTIEFTAPASGTYTVFCSVGSHRQLGMEGDLKVE